MNYTYDDTTFVPARRWTVPWDYEVKWILGQLDELPRYV